MQKSMEKYARLIESGKINPLVRYDGKSSGVIFDPGKDDVPTDVLGFGIYQLENGPFSEETGEREWVLVPQDGDFRVEVEDEVYEGAREGGPFACTPECCNAGAVYVPRESSFKVSGKGEMVFYTSTASKKREPAFVKPESRKYLGTGAATWWRGVIVLVSPENYSCNLVIGETYSPPGLWSGTPLHVHDKDDASGGQSDHEEVYYHVSRLKEKERLGPYAVQLLMDGQRVMRAFVLTDKCAFAIPGGAHPVVAGPMSDMVYTWGLAGKEGPLGMWDLPEFKYLKKVGQIVEKLKEGRGTSKVGRSELEELGAGELNEFQRKMLELILREQGFEVTG